VRPQSRQCLRPEAFDLRQGIDAVEAAVTAPMLEDGARLARPDSGYGLQGLAVGTVEVNRSPTGGRQEHTRETQGQQPAYDEIPCDAHGSLQQTQGPVSPALAVCLAPPVSASVTRPM